MTPIEERVLIYIALAVVCAFVGVFTGFAIAAMTYLQIAVVIEALYWFGLPRPAKHRQNRILFNS